MGGRWYFLWPRCDGSCCCCFFGVFSLSLVFLFSFFLLFFEADGQQTTKANCFRPKTHRSWFHLLLHSNFLGGSSAGGRSTASRAGPETRRAGPDQDESLAIAFGYDYPPLVFPPLLLRRRHRQRQLLAGARPHKLAKTRNINERYRNAGAQTCCTCSSVLRRFLRPQSRGQLHPPRDDRQAAPSLSGEIFAACNMCSVSDHPWGSNLCHVFHSLFRGGFFVSQLQQSRPSNLLPRDRDHF